jgi:protein tyrosine phosphatase (PTP) superfamily phosphohydrolase (DUF442 family)/cytochrome c556
VDRRDRGGIPPERPTPRPQRIVDNWHVPCRCPGTNPWTMQKPLLSLVVLLSAACTSRPAPPDGEVHEAVTAPPVPPPLVLQASAYEAAAAVPLPNLAPMETSGLHNVYRLSDTIISGSEPHGEAALEDIARMGVKTILSVDGKVPDAETAAKYGLRYVHVPIQYKGIKDDEVAKIAKTFRELEGPFYVHCFHGKHRGPAGAAIGRIALDGVAREEAIAEMRQWCGTSSKYEGLYRAIALKDVPSAEETAKYEFGFEAAHAFEGTRTAMIPMGRHFDNVTLIKKAGWKVDPEHPDLDPLQEATQLHQLFAACQKMEDTAAYADDYHGWMQASFDASAQLVLFLSDCKAETCTPEEVAKELGAAYDVVSKSCTDCHKAYRD